MEETSSDLLKDVQAYATGILTQELAEGITYHTLNHTQYVVESAIAIGTGENLSDEDMEVLQISAWFHDTGYRESMSEHEAKSAEIAQSFLKSIGYADDKILRVMGAIHATRMPQTPQNLIEEVLCDADLSHLAGDDYFERADSLCREINTMHDKTMDPQEWMEKNREFLIEHSYFTQYAATHFAEPKAANLKKVKKKLKLMKKSEEQVDKLQQKIEELKDKVKSAKELTPTRGIETMFRLTSKNHLELSAIADNKANIMISINALILSIMISVLFRGELFGYRALS